MQIVTIGFLAPKNIHRPIDTRIESIALRDTVYVHVLCTPAFLKLGVPTPIGVARLFLGVAKSFWKYIYMRKINVASDRTLRTTSGWS